MSWKGEAKVVIGLLENATFIRITGSLSGLHPLFRTDLPSKFEVKSQAPIEQAQNSVSFLFPSIFHGRRLRRIIGAEAVPTSQVEPRPIVSRLKGDTGTTDTR